MELEKNGSRAPKILFVVLTLLFAALCLTTNTISTYYMARCLRMLNTIFGSVVSLGAFANAANLRQPGYAGILIVPFMIAVIISILRGRKTLAAVFAGVGVLLPITAAVLILKYQNAMLFNVSDSVYYTLAHGYAGLIFALLPLGTVLLAAYKRKTAAIVFSAIGCAFSLLKLTAINQSGLYLTIGWGCDFLAHVVLLIAVILNRDQRKPLRVAMFAIGIISIAISVIFSFGTFVIVRGDINWIGESLWMRGSRLTVPFFQGYHDLIVGRLNAGNLWPVNKGFLFLALWAGLRLPEKEVEDNRRGETKQRKQDGGKYRYLEEYKRTHNM